MGGTSVTYRSTALIAAALSLLPISARAADQPPVAAILDRAAEYLARFKDEFALLISDEHYDQRVTSDMFSGVHARQTESEMAFMWVPGGWSWLTVRNVTTMDG